MNEIWKPIKDYEGLYEISNFGRVKSYHYHNGTSQRYLHPRKVKDGYLMVALYKNKEHKNYQLHRLVAEHYLPNLYNCTEVNHIDCDKTNNHVDNLEWVTHYQNILHYMNKKKIGSKHNDC